MLNKHDDYNYVGVQCPIFLSIAMWLLLTALNNVKPYTASDSIVVAFPQDEYRGFVNLWKQLIENELTRA